MEEGGLRAVVAWLISGTGGGLDVMDEFFERKAIVIARLRGEENRNCGIMWKKDSKERTKNLQD